MSNPVMNKEILLDLGNRILEQPELLWEQEQQHFLCPCCGEDFEEHSNEQMRICLGHDDTEE
jgi:hypothetical protein